MCLKNSSTLIYISFHFGRLIFSPNLSHHEGKYDLLTDTHRRFIGRGPKGPVAPVWQPQYYLIGCVWCYLFWLCSYTIHFFYKP